MSKSSQKLLKADAKKYLNIRDVKNSFKTPPDFRTELTPYQQKKIRGMVNQVKNALGERAHDIVPIGKGRKKFLTDNGFPTFARGIDLAGGEKINSAAQYVGGQFIYKRGESWRARSRLYTEGDDLALIESCKQILKNKPKGWRTSITAAGRVIGSAQNLSNQAAIQQAAFIFNKYSAQADYNKKLETAAEFEASEDEENKDENGFFIRVRQTPKGTNYTQYVAHPSSWGMGVLFEQNKTTGVEKNGKKKAGKK